MTYTNDCIIPAIVAESGEQVKVNNPDCPNPWGFPNVWHFTEDERIFHDDELIFLEDI